MNPACPDSSGIHRGAVCRHSANPDLSGLVHSIQLILKSTINCSIPCAPLERGNWTHHPSIDIALRWSEGFPREVLNKIDDDGLHHLISDFIGFRDDYLHVVEADLTNAYVNSDPPPWEDYTEETDHQIEAELQRTKEKTDTVLQIFLNEWEKRGGNAAQLLKEVEEQQIAREREIHDRKQQLQEQDLPNDQKVPNLLKPLNNGGTLPTELEDILALLNHKPSLEGNHNGAPGKI